MATITKAQPMGPWATIFAGFWIGWLTPVGLLLIGGFFYWVLGDLVKGLGIGVSGNLALFAQALGMVAIIGAFVGVLAGFVIARKRLGYIHQYLFLVALGSAVPLVGSLIQYRLYRADPSQFSIDDKVQNALGRSYSAKRQAETAQESARLASVAQTLRAVVSALAGQSSVTYLDPLSKWDDPAGCRRMNLADLADRFCIERQTAYSRVGKLINYMPVVRRADGATGPPYIIDSLLLTGKYHCPVEQDVFGAGGLTMFKGEAVSAGNMRVCFGVAAAALEARAADLANQQKLFAAAFIMPYWYFLASCLYAFVGANSFAIQPLGAAPTVVDASLVVFRYVYLTVLVTTWVDSVRPKA